MMNVIPWRRNPSSGDSSVSSPVTQFRWDLDRLFDRFFDDPWASERGFTGGMPLDLVETDDEVRVTAEVPGMDPEDLDISLNGDVLTISGEKKSESESGSGGRYHVERRFGSFQRAVRLTAPVEPDKVRAEHRNGVVTITLTKSEVARPRRIEVRSA